jgi:hypothetical protein
MFGTWIWLFVIDCPRYPGMMFLLAPIDQKTISGTSRSISRENCRERE